MAAEKESDGGGALVAVGTKRQRRPSVRLGDIGGGGAGNVYFYPDHQPRRRATKQPGKTPQSDNNLKSSKQTLTIDTTDNNVNDKLKKKSTSNENNDNAAMEEEEEEEEEAEDSGDGIAIGSLKARALKSKLVGFDGNKARSNSNSGSKLSKNQNGNDETNRNFKPLDCEELEEDQEVHVNSSPITSSDNNGNCIETERGDLKKFYSRRRKVWGLDEMGGPSGSSDRNGVKSWLNKLGLGRYASVFEIHEVDDQVLPLLTLDDLKDMGINAVGSRRKMFCSIQKLNKGL